MVSLTSINLSITYAEHAQHCARSHGIYKLFLLQGADSLLWRLFTKWKKDGVNFKVTDKVVPTIDRALGHLAVVPWAGQQPGKVQREEADSPAPQKSSSSDWPPCQHPLCWTLRLFRELPFLLFINVSSCSPALGSHTISLFRARNPRKEGGDGVDIPFSLSFKLLFYKNKGQLPWTKNYYFAERAVLMFLRLKILTLHGEKKKKAQFMPGSKFAKKICFCVAKPRQNFLSSLPLLLPLSFLPQSTIFFGEKRCN